MAGTQSRPQAKFVEGNLFRHITVMSLTASVGLMAIFAVDLMNMVFISWLKDEEITAAVGYAGAILFFTTAFGIGLSIAVSALVARAVGMRDLALARQKATNGLILGIIIGVVFSAVVWVFLPQIVALLGATGRTAEWAVHFLAIVTPAQPFLMVGMIGGAILRSHGDARRAIAAMEARYREDTGIASLKIRHNGVLGYFIEVAARHADVLMAPDSGFTHRQTMAGAVRFNALALHEEASRIAEAGGHALAAEEAHFEELCSAVVEARHRGRDAALSRRRHASHRCRPSQ